MPMHLVLGMAYQDRGMSEGRRRSGGPARLMERRMATCTILKGEFEKLGLDEDAAREQAIADRIAEETARQQGEYCGSSTNT